MSDMKNSEDDALAPALSVDALANLFETLSLENFDDDASALTSLVNAVPHPSGISPPENSDEDASALTSSVDAVAQSSGISYREKPGNDASALTPSVDAVAHLSGVSPPEKPGDNASALTTSVYAVARSPGISYSENSDEDASALTSSVDAVAQSSGISYREKPGNDASALTPSVDAVAHLSGVSSPEKPGDNASALTTSVDAVARSPGVSNPENPGDGASALTSSVDADAHLSGVSHRENPDDDASALTTSVDAVVNSSGISPPEKSGNVASALTSSVEAAAHSTGISSPEKPNDDASALTPSVDAVGYCCGLSSPENSDDDALALTLAVDAAVHSSDFSYSETSEDDSSAFTPRVDAGAHSPEVSSPEPLTIGQNVTESSALNLTKKTPRSVSHGDAGFDKAMEPSIKIGTNSNPHLTGDVLDSDDVQRNAIPVPDNALPTFFNYIFGSITPDKHRPFGKNFNSEVTAGFKGHDPRPPRIKTPAEHGFKAQTHCSSYTGGPENPMLKPMDFPGNGLHSVFGQKPPKHANQCLASGANFVQSTANYLIDEHTSTVNPMADQIDISMRPFASGVINKYAQGNLLNASSLLTRNGTLKPIGFPHKDPIGSYNKYVGRGNLCGEANLVGASKVPIPLPSSGQFPPNDNPNGKYLGSMRDVVPDAPPSTPSGKQQAQNASKAEPFPPPSSSILQQKQQSSTAAEISKQKAIIKNQINMSVALTHERVHGPGSINQMVNANQAAVLHEFQTLQRDLGDVYRQLEWQDEQRDRFIVAQVMEQAYGRDAGETSSGPKYLVTSQPPMPPYKAGKVSTVPTLPKSIDCHRQPNAAHLTEMAMAKDKKRISNKSSTTLQKPKVKTNVDMALTSSSSEEKVENKNCTRKIPSGKDFLQSSIKYLGQEDPNLMKPKFACGTDSMNNAPVSTYLLSSSSAEEHTDIAAVMKLIKNLPSNHEQDSQYSSLSTDYGTNQPHTEVRQTDIKKVSEISQNCDSMASNQQKSAKLSFEENVSEMPTLPKALSGHVEPVAAGSNLEEIESKSTANSSDKRETTTKENALQMAKTKKKTPNLSTENASEKKDFKKMTKKGKSKNRRDADYAKRKATLKKELTDSSVKNLTNEKLSKQDPDVRLLSLTRKVDDDSQTETDSETGQKDVSTVESKVTKKETQISTKKSQEQRDISQRKATLSNNVNKNTAEHVNTGKKNVDATEIKMNNKRKIMKKHAAQQAKQTTKLNAPQQESASVSAAEKIPGKKMFGNLLSDERIVTPIPPESPVEQKNPYHDGCSTTKGLVELTPRDSESESIEEEILQPNKQQIVKAAEKLSPKKEKPTKAGKTGKPSVTAREKNTKTSKLPRSKPIARAVPTSAKKVGGGAKVAQKKTVNPKTSTVNKKKKTPHLPYDFNRIEKILTDLKVTNKYTQIWLKKVGFVMNLEKNVSLHTFLNSKLKAGTKKVILAKLEIEDDLTTKVSKKQTKKGSTKKKTKINFENAVLEYRFDDESSINDMHFDEIVEKSQCLSKAKQVWKHAKKRQLQLTNARAILASAYEHPEQTKNDKDSSSETSDEEEPIEEQIECVSTDSASSDCAFKISSTESVSPPSSPTESTTNDQYEDDFEFCSDEDEEIEEAKTFDREKPLTYFPAMQTATSRPFGSIATDKSNKRTVTFAPKNIVFKPKRSISTSPPSTPPTASPTTSPTAPPNTPPTTSPTIALASALPDSDVLATQSNATAVVSTVSNAVTCPTVSNAVSFPTVSNTTPLASKPSATTTTTTSQVPMIAMDENKKSALTESTPIVLTHTKEEIKKMWDDFLPEPPKAPTPPPKLDIPKQSSESFTDPKPLSENDEEEEVDSETARENAELDKALFELAKFEREKLVVFIALIELKGKQRSPEELTMLYEIINDPEKAKVLMQARKEFERTGDAFQAAQPFWQFCSENVLKPEVKTSCTGDKKLVETKNSIENTPSMEEAKLQKMEFRRKQQQALKKCSKMHTSATCGFYQTNTPRPKTPHTKNRIGNLFEEQKTNDQPKSGDQKKAEEQPQTGDQQKSDEQPKIRKEVECGKQTKTADAGESDKKPKPEATHDELPKPVKIQVPKKRITDEPLPPLPTKGIFSCDLMQKKSTHVVVAASSKTQDRELPPIPQKKVVSLKALKRVETDKCMSGEKVKKKASRPKEISWDLVNKRRNKIAPFNTRLTKKEDMAIVDIDEEIAEPQQEVCEEPEEIITKKPWWRRVIAFGKTKLFGCCLSSNDNEIIVVQESQATEQ